MKIMNCYVKFGLIIFGLLFTTTSFAHEIGLQMYSLRNQFAEDPAKSLDQIQDWGIKSVEGGRDLYGFTVEEMRAELDKHDIQIVSTDTNFEEVRDNPMAAVYRAKFFGARYTTVYWIPHQDSFDIEDAKAAVKVFNQSGIILKKHGITLQYHPHGYESLSHANETILDYMIKNITEAKFQMDVFWFKIGGMEPIDFLKKYPGRFTSLHLKDRRYGTGNKLKLADYSDTNVVLGNGDLGIAEIVAEAKKQGIKHFFIEDESTRVLQQIPLSIEYLRSLDIH
jgi:sugar phosphate isomerase/epimerase